MHIYLVYERQSYCDYAVVFVTSDKDKSQEVIDEHKDKKFWIEEIEFEELKEIEW